jgi:glycosyltransferase involved in cell wall biosynthesis
MAINFFFRKQSINYHSIEELFFNIQSRFPKSLDINNIYCKFQSRGILRRIYNIIEAAFNQGEINHITGDIHYISYLLCKKKTILTIHDIAPILRGNKVKRAIIKFFWFWLPSKRVKYISVISEFTKNELLKQININPEKIVVIPNCISTNFKFVQKDFNIECPVILQIGTKENKNILRLIEAIKNINCKLIIVGNLTKNIEYKLKEYKIDFENYFDLKFHEIINQYKNADIISFISTYEGFGIPILEANATGRVVITSNISPMKDVAGNAALLVDPYNITEIHEGILNLIKNQELRNSLINNGIENIKKYSIDLISEKYLDLYNKI